MPSTKLKSVSMTPFGRLSEDFLSLVQIAIRPIMEFNDTCAIRHVYISTFAAAELCGIDEPMGAIRAVLENHYPELNADFVGPFRTGAEALYEALSAGSDTGDTLLIGCEKMTHISASAASGRLAPRVLPPAEQLYGATLPALSALATQAYLSDFRVPYRALHMVSVKNHRHGRLNDSPNVPGSGVFRRRQRRHDVYLRGLVCAPEGRLPELRTHPSTGSGYDAVRVVCENGLFVAKGASARISGNSFRPFPRLEDSRSS